jgi:hypothetical protein
MYILFLWPILVGLVWVLSDITAQILVRCYIHHYGYCLLAVFIFSITTEDHLTPFLLYGFAVLFLYRIVEFFPVKCRYICFLIIMFLGIITCSLLVILFFAELIELFRVVVKAPYFFGTQTEIKDFLAFISYGAFQSFRYLIGGLIKSLLKSLKSKFK